MPITQLGLGGYGVRRAGDFSGRGPEHPVGLITRFGLDGYGVRRAGDFSGRGAVGHPVGIITRLGLGGYTERRVGSFADKAVSEIEIEYIVTYRRRRR